MGLFQLSENAGAWHSQLTHTDSLMYMLGYPVFVYVASLFLTSIGLKNAFVKHHLLTTQVLRVSNAVVCLAMVVRVFWKNPNYLFEPFVDNRAEPQLDFLARFVGCGFHTIDMVDIFYAHYKGYMPMPIRWDLIFHHLSVCVLGITFNYVRAEGLLCFMFGSDMLPLPTFFILLLRACTEEGLCLETTSTRLLVHLKVFRLVLIVARIPLWFFLAFGVMKEISIVGLVNTSPALLLVLVFVVMICCIDAKWANQMVVGLNFTRKRYEVREVTMKKQN